MLETAVASSLYVVAFSTTYVATTLNARMFQTEPSTCERGVCWSEKSNYEQDVTGGGQQRADCSRLWPFKLDVRRASAT